ncbi:hypothetical protein COTS27_00099 [Spirochaetota bacterium]|nr:hypothetical protein COTS27_00099 [Spirochaetota bacterium]
MQQRAYQRTSSNPMLNEERIRALSETTGQTAMTANGAVNKTTILLMIVFAGALVGWNSPLGSFTLVSAFGALIIAIITAFKPSIAPITAPIYAILEGLLLGGISSFLEQSYPGIAFQAIVGTISVFFIMMILYRTGAIKVTDRFRSIIVSAIMGIMATYLISFVLSFFMQVPLFTGGWLAIGFSAFVIIIAAFSLLLDFDMIERSETFGAPKYMEWYCAFSLLVTLVWLYFEILRLLSMLRGRE